MNARNPLAMALLATALLGLLGFAGPASALGAPVLQVDLTHSPSAASNSKASPAPGIPLGGYANFAIRVSNAGDTSTTAAVDVTFDLPTGLQAIRVTDETNGKLNVSQPVSWACAIAAGGHSVSCDGPSTFGSPAPIAAGQEACRPAQSSSCRIVVTVGPTAGTRAGGTLTANAEACGGGAVACAQASDPVSVVPHFQITRFDGGTFDGNLDPITAESYDPIVEQSGNPVARSGAHPMTLSATFSLTLRAAADGYLYATGDLKDAFADLPAGLIANVEAVPTCADAELATGDENPQCPLSSQVGFVGVHLVGNNLSKPGVVRRAYYPLFNMEPPDGKVALFGVNISGAIYHLTGRLVQDESVPGGYRTRAGLVNTPQAQPLEGASVTLWGVPADPVHDQQRGFNDGHSFGADVSGSSCVVPGGGPSCAGNPSTAPEKPFITLPTSCEGAVRTDLVVNTYQGDEAEASFLSHDDSGGPLGTTGCDTIEFEPSLRARPTTNVADSPTGLEVNLHIPQDEDPHGAATAHLRNTTVTLPEGMAVNPSGANGLGACSPAQIELDGEAPAGCPDASKVGTAQVDTPLLGHPVEGAVYVATPYDNPFNSLLAIYVALNDPKSGIVVKIAGEVTPDPQTGRLALTVSDAPQLPIEGFRLRFFGGAAAVLRTPATCGTYSTTSALTPWSAPRSGPPAEPSDTYAIEQSSGGGTCPTSEGARPNSPAFDAGTISPVAGAASPLVVDLRRQDGSQQFSSVTLAPPQGLVGKLAGVPSCPDDALAAAAAKSGRAEEASPSCPLASYVGSVAIAAGAGPAPYYAPGKAFLSGPYKGAPVSLAIVTPATVGPFDLGTIVVRAALYIDPKTLRITAVSDPIPSILRGIPLDVRSVQVRVDRPDFTINPTSCDPSLFGGRLTSTLGQTAPLQSRFQVGRCRRLGFKPRLSLSLEGGTRRNGHPALTAVLRMPPGGANLAHVSVALPHSEFLAQEHIRTICTRAQFAASACPAAAIYGTATAITPLLDQPLTGPVYLRSSDNRLPDLVPDLRGPASRPIKLEAAGRTDTVKGGIRNTFDFIPDAPVTKLVLKMRGGRKGLLVNPRDICTRINRATVKFAAHNGLTLETHPALKVVGCPKKAKHKAQRARGLAPWDPSR